MPPSLMTYIVGAFSVIVKSMRTFVCSSVLYSPCHEVRLKLHDTLCKAFRSENSVLMSFDFMGRWLPHMVRWCGPVIIPGHLHFWGIAVSSNIYFQCILDIVPCILWSQSSIGFKEQRKHWLGQIDWHDLRTKKYAAELWAFKNGKCWTKRRYFSCQFQSSF